MGKKRRAKKGKRGGDNGDNASEFGGPGGGGADDTFSVFDDAASIGSMGTNFSVDGAETTISKAEADEISMAAHADKLYDEIELLTEKRATVREGALKTILALLMRRVCHDCVCTRRDTIADQLLSCIRRGRPKEAVYACMALNIAIITMGADSEGLYPSLAPTLVTILTNNSKKSPVRRSAVKTLAIACFIANTEDDDTFKCMQTFMSVFSAEAMTIHKQLGGDDGDGDDDGGDEPKKKKTGKIKKRAVPAEVCAESVEGWSLLATVTSDKYLTGEISTHVLPLFRDLLHHPDLSVKKAVGEAIALIYDAKNRMRGDWKQQQQEERESAAAAQASASSSSSSSASNGYQEVEEEDDDELIDLLHDIATEYNRHKSKKERKQQRSIFRDIYDTVSDGEVPTEMLTVAHEEIEFSSWAEIIRLNALRACLKGGILVHFRKNQLLREIFDLGAPPAAPTNKMSSIEKRMFLSPNSHANRQRTNDRTNDRHRKNNVRSQFLNAD